MKSHPVKGAGARALLAGVCVASLLWGSPASVAKAFITDQTGDEVSMLDLTSQRVVARIPVLGKSAGIAMARDGRTADVTSTEGKYVSVIDTASRKIVSKIAIPDTPLGIAAGPAGRAIYVAGFYRPRLHKIDLATDTLAASVRVGAPPSRVAVTPDGALIVTADRDGNRGSTFARMIVVTVTFELRRGHQAYLDPEAAANKGQRGE
ncbi:MAG: YncE family protein [Methylocella sp.]